MRRRLMPMRANQRARLLSLAFMACSFRKSDGDDKNKKPWDASGPRQTKRPWALSAPTARNHPQGVLPDPRRTAIRRTAQNSGKHFFAHAPDLLEKMTRLYRLVSNCQGRGAPARQYNTGCRIPSYLKEVVLEAVPMRVAGRDTLPIRIGPAQQPDSQAKETQVIALAKREPDKPQAQNGFAGDVVEEASHES